MLKRLCTALSDINIQEQDIDRLEIEPVRYKPGLHCMFRYKLRTDFRVQEYYGKLFSKNVPVDENHQLASCGG